MIFEAIRIELVPLSPEILNTPTLYYLYFPWQKLNHEELLSLRIFANVRLNWPGPISTHFCPERIFKNFSKFKFRKYNMKSNFLKNYMTRDVISWPQYNQLISYQSSNFHVFFILTARNRSKSNLKWKNKNFGCEGTLR